MVDKISRLEKAVLYPVCFTLRNNASRQIAANLYGLAFPTSWEAPLKRLQAEKTGRSFDKVSIPIASLNATLATFLPYLASLPNRYYKTNTNGQIAGDTTPTVWLLSRQPVELTKLWAVLRAWLKVQFKSCESYPEISRLLQQADLKDWQRLPPDLFDSSNARLPNGTANLARLAYTALPVLLADELIQKETTIRVSGQPYKLVRVPVSQGAELMSWPPAKADEHYFSYTIRITVQTLVGLAEPVVHIHYGVRRWESRPLVQEDKTFYSKYGRTVYLYRTLPWLEIPAVNIFTTTRLKAGYHPERQRREALWDNDLPEIAQALGVSIPEPEEVVREPLKWLPPDPPGGVVVALPVKDNFHRVGKGLSLDEHRELTAVIASKLAHLLIERPQPVRLAHRNSIKDWKEKWELREFPVEQRQQGLRQTVSDQITIEVWWQTPQFRDMMVDRIKSWLFGDRPPQIEVSTPNSIVSVTIQNTASEDEVITEDYLDSVLSIAERDWLDLAEDDEGSSDNNEGASQPRPSSTANEEETLTSVKRPKKKRFEPPPSPAEEPEEFPLGPNGERLRIIPRRQDALTAPFVVEGELPRTRIAQGNFRRDESKNRVRQIQSELEVTKEPTLVIIELPNFRAPGRTQRERLNDPKLALRRGLAATGRLTKFVDVAAVSRPKYNGSDQPKPALVEQALRERCNGTIRDGLRMLGFLPAPLTFQFSPQFELSPNLYIAGLWFIRLTVRKTLYKTVNLPVMVLVPSAADRPVLLWLPGHGLQPYYKGLLTLTSLDENTARPLRDRAGQATTLGQLTNFLRLEAGRHGIDELVVLTVSQNIRQFWPGFNNAHLINDRLVLSVGESVGMVQASPDISVALSELNYKLRIIRLRTNLYDETPEWYTDLSTQPGHGYTQGIWQLPDVERTFYNLSGKPLTQKAKRKGKQAHPDETYALPSILEINTVGLQPGDDPQMWARAVDQWRRMSYTYTDMTLYPLPLHWASKLNRYAEAGGAWIFSENWEEVDEDQPDDFDADTNNLDGEDSSEGD